ncbi:UNVERIFIED_CONTAM: Retrovirus-related Pol polyprotein from transposon RE1 [Sesamum radiatum]|uniref:Retrovirus-related Pol polyprotein from transposon RE1 n=1 Tax=Sesamum radiatum TaxID=300843 RepID=A0AAW2V2Q3_SESRA
MLDPLPDIEKTFSMVYAVEEQRAVQADLEANSSHLAYQLALNKNRKPGGNKFVQQKKLFIDKKSLVCINCHKKGHARDTCFRLHGVPDWYKSLGDRNKKGKAFTATVDVHNEELTKNSSYNVVDIVAEVMKMMQKTTMPSDLLTNYANYAQFDGEFAGGANHVRGNIALFNSYAEPTHSHMVQKGHASVEAIKHIQDLDCKDGVSDKPCDTCHRAKQNITPHKAKFHSRALKCILIGYAMHQKAYKLFDLDHQSVIYSRDVEFYETQFPFSGIEPDNTQHILPTVPLQSDYMTAPLSEISDLTPKVENPNASPVNAPQMIENHSVDTKTATLRRSCRHVNKPRWLADFISCTTTPSILYSCPDTYSLFVASLMALHELRNYLEAMQHTEWQDEMKTELDALEDSCTWKPTPLPEGKHPIGCKWVFKTKLRADGSVERYKARLVAKGFNQIPGVDYNDNFSPVAKTVTVRLFLALAAARGWPLQQMDVNNSFLHGHLNEDLYMTPLEGYSVEPGLVCKLERSIYRLKQASRQWNVELMLKLTDFGFQQSAHDHCLFTKDASDGFMELLVYVDDILVTTSSMVLIQAVKDYLHSLFTIKDLGHARFFLGLEIARNSDGLYIAQTKYVQDIV